MTEKRRQTPSLFLLYYAISEFLEEYLQEILDPVFRNIVFDENNEVKLFTTEALEAGLLGAAMAAVFDGFGIGSAIDVRNDSAVDAQITRELLKKGLSDAEIDKAIAEFRNIVPYNTMSYSAVKEMFVDPAEQTRNAFSSAGQAAFDIAMEGAADKESAARQFEIKYREGELGYAFEVDEDSELTPSMQEAAYKYGAEAAKTVAKGTNTEYNNTYTEADNGRKVHLRDGGERTYGENTGKQIRVVEEGSGRDQSRQTQSQPRDSEAASLTLGKEVSTASFYIPNGSTTDKIYRIAGGETTAMKNARAKASERGLNVVFFAGGNLTVDGEPARGYISGKNVLIRADDPNFTAAQIMEHEIGHDKIAKGEIDLDTVKDRLNSVYGAETVDFICQQYVEAYEGSNLAPEKVFEEMVCDSLGDMNAFDSESEISGAADGFLATTKALTEASARAATNPDALVEGKASTNIKEENKDGEERSVNRTFEGASKSTERGAKIKRGTSEKNGKALPDIRERQRGVDHSFGAKPNMQWADGNVIVPSTSSVEYAEQAIVAEYGIASFVIKKDIYDLNHKTSNAQAFCYKNQIFFREQMSEEFRGIAAMHEITHIMRNLRFEPYMKFLKNATGAFNFASADTKEMVARVAKHINYSPNLLVTKPDYVKERVLDELCAMIYGHISAARSGNLTYDQITEGDRILQNVLNDSDAFLAELTEIHLQFKESNSGKASYVLPSDRTSKPLTVEQKEIWKRVQKMTPMQIANMQLEDIDPLPKRTPKAPSGINADNGKESNFFGSAMDSDNVAEDTKRLIKTVDDIRYYAGVSNEETLNEANDRLNLKGQTENNRFFALNPGNATAVDVAEGFILLKRYQDKGDFETACEVARKLRKIGTSAGQTVQTFSIYSYFLIIELYSFLELILS